LVAAGGTALVLAAAATTDGVGDGPPWPLTRAEVDAFAVDGVVPVLVEDLADPDGPSIRRWRAEFRRPGRSRRVPVA
jgi:hypothetical protein